MDSRGMKWLLPLLLAGCSTVPVDGVIPIKWHRTDKAWLEASKFMPVTRSDMFSMQGGSFWDGKVCHVFAPDEPIKNGKYRHDQWSVFGRQLKNCFDCVNKNDEKDDALAVLGHEGKHCFDGPFHKNAIKE